MIGNVPPFLIFLVGAFLTFLLPQHRQGWFSLLVTLVALANFATLPHGTYWQVQMLEYQLTFGRIDTLGYLFGLMFHIAAVIATLFALHVRDPVQNLAALLYAGGAVGAVAAGDLITLFIFWEVMAVASTFLIWARRSAQSNRTGQRYLLVQVTSGVLLLAGAAAHLAETGSIAFNQIGLGTFGGTLIFIAFGIKCAFPLLHGWLVDAYPQSTPTGTVFLCVFTTKLAVYALARGFPGTEILIYLGATMAMFPIFYAVIENDLRRVLSYSMINQIGFMVCGIGLGTELALNGAVSHAFNDVLFKGLLFMSMGAVLHMTGRINGTDLGGLYKSMPITTALCIVGAASISAFPLFSGFVSKSMVMAAAAEEGHSVVFLLLLFASAGVFHHAGIKIPYFAFFGHDSGIRTREPPINMLIAMAVAAGFCVFNGCYPWILYSLLPWEVSYQPYTWSHIISQSQLLFFSALAFSLLMTSGLYPPEMKLINLDVDWLYRRLGLSLIRATGRVIIIMWTECLGILRGSLEEVLDSANSLARPGGVLARTWSTATGAMWVLVILAAYLLLYYR
ncbi:MAG TPA: Na(+)/H(+) antiporter subunit D [Alphaproteobacteria bacterium]|nr:Na(+)/H(+) antiporter subunit D [Alphaproteobacteria bacterium]HIB17876.1 Na(+)/H(+) antiporter subunit D [Alphaproteobacteria bacterium]HIN91339.1 Na(+)/H(+) antiporter subunit D [Alphaproteobacteria bacterium]